MSGLQTRKLISRFALGLVLGAIAGGSLAQGSMSESPLPSLDPAKPIHQYVHQVWTTEDGLPSNTIRDMAQTPDGYLWLATHAGLVRFDGVRFTTFDAANTSSFANNFLTRLCLDREGTLWVGSTTGLVKLQDGVFSRLTTADGLAGDAVEDLLEDRTGVLWVVAAGELHRLEDDRISVIERPEEIAEGWLNSVAEGLEGELWLTTLNDGLIRWHGSEWQQFSVQDGLPDNRLYTTLLDRDGVLWIAESSEGGGGLFRYRGGRFVDTKTGDPSMGRVRRFLEGRDGTLWMASEGGVRRFANGRFDAYRVEKGVPGYRVTSLFEDQEGGLWLGTYSGGLQRLVAGVVTTHSSEDGIRGGAMAIYEDGGGNLWVGGDGGLARYEGRRFVPAEGVPFHIAAIGEDNKGDLWLGAEDALLRYSNSEIRSFSQSNKVSLVVSDGRDGLLLGHVNAGLRLFKEGVVSEIDGLEDVFVRWIHRDERGVLWLGTEGRGLLQLIEGRPVPVTADSDLSHDKFLSFHRDDDGALWLGTGGTGLLRLKDEALTRYSVSEGLHDNSIFAILEDEQGNLWMSCDRGIFTVSKKDLADFDAGRVDSITSTSYGVEDGLKTLEGLSLGNPSGWRTRDGRLWFATMQGVAEIDPRRLDGVPALPPILIEGITVDGVGIAGRDFATIQPGAGTLEIRFTTPTFHKPKEVEFQYLLGGVDNGWRAAGRSRLAVYTNLPPGTHRFEVRARRRDGAWSSTQSTLELVVLPAWHQTLWLRGAAALALVGLVTAVFRFSVRRVQERNEELEREISRRREAEQSMQASEMLSRATLDSLASPVVVLDGDGTIIKVNETWKQFAAQNGAAADLIEGLGWNYFDVCRSASGPDGDFAQYALTGLEAVLERRMDVFDMEYPCHSPSEKRWFLMRAVPMGGSERGIVVSHIDITTRRMAELELRSSEEKARQQREQLAHVQRTASLGELTGALSHEISQPLTAIRSNTQAALSFLSGGEPDLDELREILEDIDHDDRRATEILRRLRGLLQRKPIKMAALDLNWALSEMVALFRSEALLEKVEIQLDLEEALPVVEGDSVQIQQVIMNLMNNAMDAVRESGREVRRIVISSSIENGAAVRVSIADFGSGFGDRPSEQLFEAFQTTKPEGLGIGLAISRTIVEAHGGRIWAENNPEGGAIFHFTMPVGSGNAD